MARHIARNLFGDPDEPTRDPTAPTSAESATVEVNLDAPLAERMRPRTLDEYVGQGHLVGEGRMVRKLFGGTGSPPSLILWGGPGTGKTTLARLIARQGRARFAAVSAVLSGVKDLREVIAQAKEARKLGERTVLFVDEIHRFNKAQQDAMLPSVEDGTVSLIGASTENPSFEVNAALLSRARVLTLHPLTETDLDQILRRALADADRGLARLRPKISDVDLAHLARSSGGDARVALTALEAATLSTDPDPSSGVREVHHDSIIEALGRARFAYDKGGEDHYNLASALIKSVRNSDVDAGLYWLARLIEGGADPVFIARRLCILASEDIGLADPQALVQAASAAEVVRLVGLPEGLYPLAQATIYLAQAPKSNAVKRSYFAAATDAAATAREPVPLHLRNAVTSLMRAEGYGEGYRYVHSDPDARTSMRCRPESIADHDYWSL